MPDHVYLTDNINEAFENAVSFTSSHYENFPVVSLFLPKQLRKHVAVVYQFARQADDIADEGNFTPEVRLEKLSAYRQQLSDSLNNKFHDTFWKALAETIRQFKLTQKYFFDLLSAFEQDITKTRYNTFDEVLNYCARSANPVGRIILELFKVREDDAFKFSDSVCSGLQLANFYQDISIDILKNRIYIPMEDLNNFGVRETVFETKENNANFRRLLKSQTDRARALLENGKNILKYLPGSLRFQIRLTILGGIKILEKIEKLNYNTLSVRPKLNKHDIIIIFMKALLT